MLQSTNKITMVHHQKHMSNRNGLKQPGPWFPPQPGQLAALGESTQDAVDLDGGSKAIGFHSHEVPKIGVYFMENLSKMDDD